MGGGNGQKSKTKRDRNNEKKMKDAKAKNHAANKGKIEADRTALKCKICMTTFMVTASVCGSVPSLGVFLRVGS